MKNEKDIVTTIEMDRQGGPARMRTVIRAELPDFDRAATAAHVLQLTGQALAHYLKDTPVPARAAAGALCSVALLILGAQAGARPGVLTDLARMIEATAHPHVYVTQREEPLPN